MAVTPVAEPRLKSTPDMAKLNAFSDITVTVTKHMAPTGTTGQMITPTQRMSKDQLLALLTHLPLQYGPGFYRFEAVDTGGQGEDQWMVKLGAEVAPTQEGLPMGQPPFMQQPPVPGMPLDADVKQIMPRFFFNEALGLLTTPWGETVQWRMGDPWPRPPASAGHLSLVPPNATPFNWQQWPQQPGGWGSYPATETKSPELEAMKLQIAEDRRRVEEAERRREEREREDRLRDETKRDREAADARFEKMFALLSTKPTGPSESEIRLQREIEETRRRTELAEQRAAEAQREAQRREEQRIADERHREEMRLMREEIKAATANKTDPMMTLFGTILSTQSTSATETARMIRETGDRAAAASERSATQVLELARSQRDAVGEANKHTLDGMKSLMDTSTAFYQQMLEVANSSSSNQPWYAGAIQEGIGKIGLIGQAIMERNQQQAQQPQYMPPQRIVQGRPVPMQPGMRPMQPPMQPQVAPVANTRPPDAEYDQATEEFVFPDGWRVKQAIVQQNGWAAVLKRRPPVAAPVATPAPAPAPTNGATAAPVAAVPPQVVVAAPPPVVTPDAVLPPAPAAKPRKPGKKKRGAATEEPVALPPPANGVGYALEELRAMDPDQVDEIVSTLDDTVLFGAMLSYVNDLRARAAKGLTPAKAAEFILGTRQYIHSFGASPPPAFELLAAEQLEVLVERLLPEAPEEYQDAVVDIMEKALDAENPSRGAEIEAQ